MEMIDLTGQAGYTLLSLKCPREMIFEFHPDETSEKVSPRWNNNQNLIPSQLNKSQKDLTG